MKDFPRIMELYHAEQQGKQIYEIHAGRVSKTKLEYIDFDRLLTAILFIEGEEQFFEDEIEYNPYK